MCGKNQNEIDKILTSKAYSYLPNEAKEYVKEVYEKTGEVILTEKNKEENKPYLNPNYVDYLVLGNEEKKNIGNELVNKKQITFLFMCLLLFYQFKSTLFFFD